MENPSVPENHHDTPEQSEHTSRWGAPRGAFAFVLLMLIVYAVYFFIEWANIIGRGGA